MDEMAMKSLQRQQLQQQLLQNAWQISNMHGNMELFFFVWQAYKRQCLSNWLNDIEYREGKPKKPQNESINQANSEG